MPSEWGAFESAADDAVEERVQRAFRVELSATGEVLTRVPALLAAAVTRLVDHAAAVDALTGLPAHAVTRMHGCRPPGISLDGYAARLLRYCKCSPVCFAAAFAYIRRLQRGDASVRGGPLRCDELTVHRLMAMGVVLGAKFYDDKYYSNGHYAQVAGVSLQEFNAMELDLLFRLGFRCRVDSAELDLVLQEMEVLASDWAADNLLLRSRPVLLQGAADAPAGAAEGCRSASPDLTQAMSECSEASAYTTAAARLAAAACQQPQHGDADLCACAASAAPRPWVAAADAAAAAAAAADDAAHDAMPPRRSKRRSSLEAAHAMRLLHETHSHALVDAVSA